MESKRYSKYNVFWFYYILANQHVKMIVQWTRKASLTYLAEVMPQTHTKRSLSGCGDGPGSFLDCRYVLLSWLFEMPKHIEMTRRPCRWWVPTHYPWNQNMRHLAVFVIDRPQGCWGVCDIPRCYEAGPSNFKGITYTKTSEGSM